MIFLFFLYVLPGYFINAGTSVDTEEDTSMRPSQFWFSVSVLAVFLFATEAFQA